MEIYTLFVAFKAAKLIYICIIIGKYNIIL